MPINVFRYCILTYKLFVYILKCIFWWSEGKKLLYLDDAMNQGDYGSYFLLFLASSTLSFTEAKNNLIELKLLS